MSQAAGKDYRLLTASWRLRVDCTN
jgi:hypothetical protein